MSTEYFRVNPEYFGVSAEYLRGDEHGVLQIIARSTARFHVRIVRSAEPVTS